MVSHEDFVKALENKMPSHEEWKQLAEIIYNLAQHNIENTEQLKPLADRTVRRKEIIGAPNPAKILEEWGTLIKALRRRVVTKQIAVGWDKTLHSHGAGRRGYALKMGHLAKVLNEGSANGLVPERKFLDPNQFMFIIHQWVKECQQRREK